VIARICLSQRLILNGRRKESAAMLNSFAGRSQLAESGKRGASPSTDRPSNTLLLAINKIKRHWLEVSQLVAYG
jgi:hypothetical protein